MWAVVTMLLCTPEGCFTIKDALGPFDTLKACEARQAEMIRAIEARYGPTRQGGKRCEKVDAAA